MKQFTIGYLSTMYHTSHLIKDRAYLEKKLILSPAWVLFPTGPAMVEAFAAGTIDLGYIGLPPAMIGIDKGVPMICIAGGHMEGTAMIAAGHYQSFDDLKSSGEVLKQFNGKRLGSPTRGSIHDVIIRNLLVESRLEITIDNYPWTDLVPEAIEAGEIEGAVGTPALAVLGETGVRHGHDYSAPCSSGPSTRATGLWCERNCSAERKLFRGFPDPARNGVQSDKGTSRGSGGSCCRCG